MTPVATDRVCGPTEIRIRKSRALYFTQAQHSGAARASEHLSPARPWCHRPHSWGSRPLGVTPPNEAFSDATVGKFLVWKSRARVHLWLDCYSCDKR